MLICYSQTKSNITDQSEHNSQFEFDTAAAKACFVHDFVKISYIVKNFPFDQYLMSK